MMPILFKIPFTDIPIYSYGLMLVIGFLCGIELMKFLARKYGLNPDLFVTAGLVALVSGVVGARASHVLENIHQYTDPSRSFFANAIDAINIRSGGLTYYGGFLLATPALLAYAVVKKIPARLGMDIVAPCLMIGLGFGRIGCFLNGCCYGATCQLPWAVTYPYNSIPYKDEVYQDKISPPAELLKEDVRDPLISGAELKSSPQLLQIAAEQRSLAVHPAQLYSSFTAFLIAALLLSFMTMPHRPGRVFAMMLVFEGLTRYLLELLRIEPPVMHLGGYGLSLSMILGLLLFVCGIVLWFALDARTIDEPSLSPAMAG